jgi:molybdenum cofactor synthesis domain-containing protein
MKAIIISISDTRDASEDVSGDLLVGLLAEFGAEVVGKLLISDDREGIATTLKQCCDGKGIDLVITTGGTGFSHRDNTPEATRDVIEREAPGLAEAMRMQTAVMTPAAVLSRAVCGIRGRTLIVNLPGSPKAVAECFEVLRPVLPHALKVLAGDPVH